jgi:chorismate lyase
VKVEVLREGVVEPREALRSQITSRLGTSLWRRDVALTVDGTPVIAARSIASARDARAAWKSLRSLGTTPLATILYQDSLVSRSGFSFARLSPMPPGNEEEEPSHIEPVIWARASLFRRKQAPLLVAEAFLPALWSLIQR